MGTFQSLDGQRSCNDCPSGSYADKNGFEECIACPYRLNSTNGSGTCPFCSQNFYFGDISTTINSSNILQYSLKNIGKEFIYNKTSQSAINVLATTHMNRQ